MMTLWAMVGGTTLAGYLLLTAALVAASGAAYLVARHGGINYQRMIDIKARDHARERANHAAAKVAGIPDADVVAELHRVYNRKS